MHLLYVIEIHLYTIFIFEVMIDGIYSLTTIVYLLYLTNISSLSTKHFNNYWTINFTISYYVKLFSTPFGDLSLLFICCTIYNLRVRLSYDTCDACLSHFKNRIEPLPRAIFGSVWFLFGTE